jgi:hypothetical protein
MLSAMPATGGRRNFRAVAGVTMIADNRPALVPIVLDEEICK